MPLPFELRAVEMALKDSKGRNIADEIDKKTTTAEVTELIKGGTIDNAKPIYCHPLHIFFTSTTIPFRVTCLVFNNSPTPFTWQTFKNWLISMTSQHELVKLMASGAFMNNGICTIASYIVTDGEYVQLVGIYNDGSNFAVIRNITDVQAECEDGVNRIN